MKQPCAQHTASPYTTAGYCYSVTIFQLCSASTVDDPDFRVLTQIRRFASVCLARNSKISIRWIPRGSTWRRICATKSLVDHVGSNDGQTFPVSRTWLSREPGSGSCKASAASDGVAIERNLLPEALSAVAEETENSLCTELADENQGPEKTQPAHDGGL